MATNRRKFLAAGVASLAASSAFSKLAPSATAAEGEGEKICLDYGLSFLCAPPTIDDNPAKNAVRFWVESRTIFFDDEAGTSTVFYQCGSCKSEHTFAEQDLFIADNYDFMPIFGGEDVLVYRRSVRLSDRYRTVAKANDYWGVPIPKLRYGKHVNVLDTWEEIRDTTAAGVPIVSQTELANAELGLRAIIECPVKTMNIGLHEDIYQVDTGPVCYPDLSKRYDRPIECLSLAFVAFNAPDFADFVIEQPTPVAADGSDGVQVYHYSKPFSLPSKNMLLSVAVPE